MKRKGRNVRAEPRSLDGKLVEPQKTTNCNLICGKSRGTTNVVGTPLVTAPPPAEAADTVVHKISSGCRWIAVFRPAEQESASIANLP